MVALERPSEGAKCLKNLEVRRLKAECFRLTSVLLLLLFMLLML